MKSYNINWGMVTALIMFVGILGYLRSCTRNAFDIADTPEKQKVDEQEQKNFEQFCTTNFEHINWSLQRLERKIDDLTPVNDMTPTMPRKP